MRRKRYLLFVFGEEETRLGANVSVSFQSGVPGVWHWTREEEDAEVPCPHKPRRPLRLRPASRGTWPHSQTLTNVNLVISQRVPDEVELKGLQRLGKLLNGCGIIWKGTETGEVVSVAVLWMISSLPLGQRGEKWKQVVPEGSNLQWMMLKKITVLGDELRIHNHTLKRKEDSLGKSLF